MIISRAQMADLDEIAALERDGFAEARWSADAWASEIAADDRHVLVMRDADGAVSGVATFQTVEDTADLHRVVVRPDQRRLGIGRRLVQAGLEWAAGLGAERMLLEVDLENTGARRLYDELGFTPIARRSDYYGPGHHAIVMACDLREGSDDD